MPRQDAGENADGQLSTTSGQPSPPGRPETTDHPPWSGGVDEETRVAVHVEGAVQGVGMRAWIAARARALELRGRATNLRDGSVEIVAQGPWDACEALLRAFGDNPPGKLRSVEYRWEEPGDEPAGFRTS